MRIVPYTKSQHQAGQVNIKNFSYIPNISYKNNYYLRSINNTSTPYLYSQFIGGCIEVALTSDDFSAFGYFFYRQTIFGKIESIYFLGLRSAPVLMPLSVLPRYF